MKGSERDKKLTAQTRRTGYKCDKCGTEIVYETDAAKNEVLKDAIDKAALADPTRFTTRSFAVLWNEGHSIRLINRDDARQAISIPWDDLDALRAILGDRNLNNDQPIH